MDPIQPAALQRRKGTSQWLEVLAFHGQDSALVRSQDGIAFYLPLSEIENRGAAPAPSRLRPLTGAPPKPQAL
jgi:hypothetical protein